MIDVAITGAAGKMGKTLIAALSESKVLNLAAAIEQPGQLSIGVDAGELVDGRSVFIRLVGKGVVVVLDI